MPTARSAREAGERPICSCHDLPMRWNKRRDLTAGGYWRCGQTYKATEKAWREANKESRAAYMLRWREANPRDRAEYMRQYRYGMEPGLYDRLMETQQGRCALCDALAKDTPKGALHVDHDHVSGRVRGLICLRCNTALERVERVGWLDRTVAYLA